MKKMFLISIFLMLSACNGGLLKDKNDAHTNSNATESAETVKKFEKSTNPVIDGSLRTQRPDLVINNIEISPATPRVRKDIISIRITIKNIGTATPSASTWLFLFLDNPPTYSERRTISSYELVIPELLPDQEHTIFRGITVNHTGFYELLALIDTENLQPGEEIDTSNNQQQFDFEVAAYPKISDLLLEKIYLNNQCRLKLKMYNNAANIPDMDWESSYIKVYINESQEKTAYLKDLVVPGFILQNQWFGNPPRVNIVWPDSGAGAIQALSPGESHSFRVVLDYNNRITEDNKDNNIKTKILTCPE